MNFYKLGLNQFFKKKKKINNFKKNRYWNNFKAFRDPDGKIRNLLNEREKKINDLKDEIKFIKKNTNSKKPRIIDLGCGFGFFLSAFDKKWEKIGIELSDFAIKKGFSDFNVFNFDLEKKFSKKQKNLLGAFDVVFSYHVIEHMNNPENLIYNAYNLLKKKGLFVIGTPNFDSGCARRYGKNYRFYNDKTHISFFSENSLYRLLNKYGFSVEKVDFPFFETEHFNKKNLNRLFDNKQISPPFYGNLMSFYCLKKTKKQIIKEKKIFLNNHKKLLKNISS